MKQITFRFAPGRGYDHDIRFVKSLLSDNWLVDADGAVVTEIPDPHAERQFLVTVRAPAAFGVHMDADDVVDACNHTWHGMVAPNAKPAETHVVTAEEIFDDEDDEYSEDDDDRYDYLEGTIY